jgi:hypothetical protein
VLLLAALPRVGAAQCLGYYDASYAASGYYASGYLQEGGCGAVPDVTGLSTAAADTALMAVGLDTGAIYTRCSMSPVNEVVDQVPQADVILASGSLVDLFKSSGVACEGARARLRLNLEVKP